MPGIVCVVRPMFSTVSIMPGIDARAPERQTTRSGFAASPNFLAMTFSILIMAASTWALSSLGYLRLLS